MGNHIFGADTPDVTSMTTDSQQPPLQKPPLKVLLCSPRGFCAGVVRAIDTPLVQCKEVLFTVDSGRGAHEKRVPYVTDACHDTKGWKWAAAEPATERWGYFQHVSH